MNSTSLNLTDDFLGPNKKANILEDGADDEQSGLNDYITTEILKSGKNDVNYISSFVAYSLVFLIFILINVFQLLGFLKIRRFFKKSLYPTRFVNELVPAVMILPLANFTSEMFYFISSSKTSKVLYVVFFVVGLIELIFFSVAFYLSNSLFGISPFISSSPINSMYGEFYVRLVCFTPYFALINGILKKFNGWILHPFILLHLAFNIYMLIRIMYRPFLKLGTNVFFMAIICACILNDAMRLVGLFFPQPNQLITMIAFFAFIVLGFIISGIFYFVQTRSIKKMISVFEDQDSFMNDSDKRQLFKDLALDKNNQRAIMILSYVWVNQFVPLLDNSLFHFIAITFHDIWTVTHIIKFISFLPANSNILNVMMNEAFKRRDLKLKHIFFLFQVQKIKMLRQSSTSTAAVERLKTLKQSTKELELKIKNFFTRSDSNLMLLYNLSKEIKKEKTFWEEVIRSYPNSIPHIDENAHFLIECATDFIEAIKQKHKSNLIESGKNYNVDQCFRRFVRVYPGFLKKGIVDMKGNFIKISRAKGNGSLSSMSSHSNNVMSSASSSSVSQIDLQVEESIGRLMIKQARIRLALQRATESRKADIYKAFIIDVLAMFAISFASFIFLYVFFDNYYDSRGDNTKRIEYANKVRLNLFATALSNLYFWGNDTKSINTSEFQPIYDDYDDPNVYFFPPDSEMDWEWKAVKFSLDARLIFRELLLDVSDMSLNAIDVYKYSNSLFEETTPVKYCDSAIPLSIPLRANLKTIVPFLLMEFTMFSTYPSKEWWKNAPDICNAFASMAVSWKGFEDLRTTLTEYGTDQMKQTQSLLYMLRILFPSIYGAVTIIPFCIIVYLFSREINMFADLIMKLPSSIKQEAYHPLRKDSDDVISTQDDQGESLSSFSLPFLLTIIISLLFLINAILIFVQVTMLNQTNLNYNYLLQWTADARIRKCNIIELIYWIYNLIFLDNPLVQGTKIINSTTITKLANY